METILALLPMPTVVLSPANTILQVSHSFAELCDLSAVDYVGLDIDYVVSELDDFGSEQILEGIKVAVNEGCIAVTEPWQVDDQFWRVKVTPLFSLDSEKRRGSGSCAGVGGGVKYLGEGTDILKGVVNIWNHVTIPTMENNGLTSHGDGSGNGNADIGKDGVGHTNSTANYTNNFAKTGLNKGNHKPRTRAAIKLNRPKPPPPNPSKTPNTPTTTTHDSPTSSDPATSTKSINKPSPAPVPGLESILLQWEDVTEETTRIQTLKDRLQSSEIYRLLVNTVRDYAIFLLDSDGYIATWNTGAMLLKQYLPHEIIGRNPPCLLDILFSGCVRRFAPKFVPHVPQLAFPESLSRCLNPFPRSTFPSSCLKKIPPFFINNSLPHPFPRHRSDSPSPGPLP
jgi:PAS domain-containing protein